MAKKSYDELVQLMRDNGFSDEEMPQALKVLMADKKIGPKLRNDYEMSQMRKKPQLTSQPETQEGFWHSLGSTFGLTPEQLKAQAEEQQEHPIKSFVKESGYGLGPLETIIANGIKSAGETGRKAISEGKSALNSNDTQSAIGHGMQAYGYAAATPLSTVLGSNITKPGEQFGTGNIKGGAGSLTGVLLPLLAGAKSTKGRSMSTSEVEKFAAITDKATAPIQKLLSEQGEALKGAMNGQLSNVAALRGNVGIRNLIAKIQNLEAVPDTKVGSLKAAREGLEELQAKIGSGKPVSWNDLFELNKRLKQANTGIADKATKQALTKITDTVNGELTNGAKQAGLGDHYTNWQKDYAQYGDLRRRYDDALSSKTDAQREVNRTAKSTRRQVFGTSVGSPKVNKLAKVNSQIIKQAHKAMDELHGQVKGRPLAKPPVPPTRPSAAAKWLPGGGVPPKPGQLPGQGIQPKPAQLPAGQYEQPGPGVNTPQPLGLPPARTPMPAISQSTWEQLLQLLSGKPKQLPPAGSIQLGPSSLPSTTPAPPTTVGSAAGAANDTALFQQAKQSLGPNASISDIAKKAQELKMSQGGVAPISPSKAGIIPPQAASQGDALGMSRMFHNDLMGRGPNPAPPLPPSGDDF